MRRGNCLRTVMRPATRTMTNPCSPTSCRMIASTNLDTDANAGMMSVQRTGRFLTIVALVQIGVSPRTLGHAVLHAEELFASVSTSTSVANFIFRGGFLEEDDATILSTVICVKLYCLHCVANIIPISLK